MKKERSQWYLIDSIKIATHCFWYIIALIRLICLFLVLSYTSVYWNNDFLLLRKKGSQSKIMAHLKKKNPLQQNSCTYVYRVIKTLEIEKVHFTLRIFSNIHAQLILQNRVVLHHLSLFTIWLKKFEFPMQLKCTEAIQRMSIWFYRFVIVTVSADSSRSEIRWNFRVTSILG